MRITFIATLFATAILSHQETVAIDLTAQPKGSGVHPDKRGVHPETGHSHQVEDVAVEDAIAAAEAEKMPKHVINDGSHTGHPKSPTEMHHKAVHGKGDHPTLVPHVERMKDKM